jgi:hypothetical protein
MKMKSPEWNAWYNIMPGNSPTMLHVTGEIDVETEGIELELKFHSLKKSLPPVLVLQLQERTIFIPREQGETNVRVHYTQFGTPGDVKGIIILDPSGNKIKEIDDSEILIAQ